MLGSLKHRASDFQLVQGMEQHGALSNGTRLDQTERQIQAHKKIALLCKL